MHERRVHAPDRDLLAGDHAVPGVEPDGVEPLAVLVPRVPSPVPFPRADGPDSSRRRGQAPRTCGSPSSACRWVGAFRHRIIVEWSDEDRAFVARVPAFPGCAAHGETPEAASREARRAAEAMLDVLREDGDRPPPKSLSR